MCVFKFLYLNILNISNKKATLRLRGGRRGGVLTSSKHGYFLLHTLLIDQYVRLYSMCQSIYGGGGGGVLAHN